MEVKPNPARRQKLINNARKVSGLEDERIGTHLSDLTICITKTFWRKFNKTQTLGTNDQTVLFFLIGLGLEKMLRGTSDCPCLGKDKRLYCLMCLHNGPHADHNVGRCDLCFGTLVVPTSPVKTKEKDGVLYTPDHFDSEFDMFDEIKSTRMGWAKDGDEPSKGWPAEWIRRMKGYCYAEGVEKWGLDVFLVIPAALHAVDFVFDLEELTEFWIDYVLPRKEILEEALRTGIPPTPFDYNDDWECDKCEFLLLCENSHSLAGLLEESL